ncbi:hypothetical protein BX616_000428 [Lobosporangium transversale]|nr:hypothetical protein BX616_000428 [Lobosporangium transversale]
MASISLKLTVALVLAAASVQAVPIRDACYQVADSGNVDVSSSTNIKPITDVTPITRYQPIVKAFAPLVDSECDYYDKGLYGGYDYDNYPYSRYGRGYCGRGYYGRTYSPLDPLNARRFVKRQDPNQTTIGATAGAPTGNVPESGTAPESEAATCPSSGSLLFKQFQAPADCQASIPAQNVDMGSQVLIQPTNKVLPSTTYQSHVQSLDSNIAAAPAQSSSLPQQNVDLGSNVFIQPTTQVLPKTSYQPEVNQLTTQIDAAPQQDQSLPQSSVLLGSQVHISPNVHVKPLTTFQPTIESLPFIIHAAPCIDQSGFSPMPPFGSAASEGSFSMSGAQDARGGAFAGQNFGSTFSSSSLHRNRMPMGVTPGQFESSGAMTTGGQAGAMTGSTAGCA